MTYETTFHIHRVTENQWQVEYYHGTTRLETVVVERQEDIGAACDKLYEKYQGIDNDEAQITDVPI